MVAGASTPAGIIKEAIKTMSENLQPVEEQMEVKESVQKSFEEMTDEEFRQMQEGLETEKKNTAVTIKSVTIPMYTRIRPISIN